jgi:hypothetical protein
LKGWTCEYIEFRQKRNILLSLDVGEAVVMDFNSVAWGILSDGGLQLEIDKSGEAFSRGQIKIRARINSDFALTNPKMVSYIRPAAV